jgi:hypothetical protein
MTSTESTTEVQNDQNDTNEMPKVDASKLPTLPQALPPVVESYKDSSSRGRVQVKHANAFLDTIKEYGQIILSQHHAEGAAEQKFEEDPAYTDQRAQVEEILAKIEAHEKFIRDQEAAIEAIRGKAIQEIVASVNGDVDFEEADAEYESARTSLISNVKNFEAAGESVHNAMKSFVREIPTSKALVEGKRKGVRSNSTMPGSVSEGDGWKPSFAWLSIDGEVQEGVTSIGQLAKAFDGGKSYDRILGRLKEATKGVARLNDDQQYSWTLSSKNLDDDSETVTTFSGVALSRATKNARANAAAQQNGSGNNVATVVPAQPDNDSAPEPEVDATDID